MMRRDATWFLLSTSVIAGSAWWVARSNAAVELAIGRLTSAVVEQSGPREPMQTACAVTLDPRVLRSEVQRALSGVRLNGEAPARAGTEPAALAEPEPGPTPEQVKAFDTATEMIDRALSRKTWSAEDVEQIRPIMIQLDPSSREEIMLRVVRSLNEGKLQATGRLGELF
jgi:hypothetical protein